MIPTDVEVWARLRLVQGRSKAQLWEFVSTRGQSLLTVGSGPGCTWVIEEDGVAPIHFSLHWDGTGLTIADTHGTGTVRVDGGQVRGNWLPLRGRARIDFGRAAIVVETSGARLDQGAFDTAPLPPVSRDMRRASSAPPINASVSGAPIPKGTLMGVPPPNGRGAIVATVPAKAPVSGVSSAPQAPSNSNQPTAQTSPSFVPKRPGDSVRPPKPTLLGMAHTPVPVTPGPYVSAAPPPQRVGGSSLADGDQRTIQGFPTGGSVQAAMSVTVTGSPSSSPPAQASSQGASEPSTVVVPQLRPLSESLQPSTALVVAQREESGRHIRQRPNAPHGDFSGRGPGIPQAVLVLSPVGGPVVQAQPRQSLSPQRPLPNWRPIVLGIFATVATYACWLYLLYHL